MKTVYVVIMLGMGVALAAETKVQMKDLPAVVQQAVKEQSKNATVIGISKETENGRTAYELETKVNGKGRDLLIDLAGAVIEVEEEVTLDSIPVPARAAIEKQAAGAKITKVETLTKGGATTYEAAITRKGKISEVTVAADGSAVK